MIALVWALMVGAGVVALVVSAGRDHGLIQTLGLMLPALIVWAVWAVGYLLGIKRRARSLALLARVARRLRCWRVVRRRRRRLARGSM